MEELFCFLVPLYYTLDEDSLLYKLDRSMSWCPLEARSVILETVTKKINGAVE